MNEAEKPFPLMDPSLLNLTIMLFPEAVTVTLEDRLWQSCVSWGESSSGPPNTRRESYSQEVSPSMSYSKMFNSMLVPRGL